MDARALVVNMKQQESDERGRGDAEAAENLGTVGGGGNVRRILRNFLLGN